MGLWFCIFIMLFSRWDCQALRTVAQMAALAFVGCAPLERAELAASSRAVATQGWKSSPRTAEFPSSLSASASTLAATAWLCLCASSLRRMTAKGRRRCSRQATRKQAKTFERLEPEDPADALIPQQPIGRLVSKYEVAALEYDPSDAPEYVCDEHGTGSFVWEPLSPEGGLLGPGEYAEHSFPVPEDRVDYLIGGGWLQSDGEEDYRAFVDDAVVESSDGRRWRNVVLRGSHEGVQAGSMRLMAGVLRRRPWDPPEALPERESQDALPSSA